MRNKKDFLVNALWVLLAALSFAVVLTMDAQDRELTESNRHELCGWKLVEGVAIRDCGDSND